MKEVINTMNQDYNIAVASFIKIIVANNAGCVARKLKGLNYPIKDFIPTRELEAELFMLHAADTHMFYDLITRLRSRISILRESTVCI